MAKSKSTHKSFRQWGELGGYEFWVDRKGNIVSAGGSIQLTAKQAIKVLKDHTEHRELRIAADRENEALNELRKAVRKADRDLEVAKTQLSLAQNAYNDQANKASVSWKAYTKEALTTTSSYSIIHKDDEIHVGCNRVPIATVRRVVKLCAKLARIKLNK